MMKKYIAISLFSVRVLMLAAQPFAPASDAQSAPKAPREVTFQSDLQPFYHGVASGDPTATSLLIWTRVTPEGPGSVEVRYYVAENLSFNTIVKSGSVTTDDSRDYTVKVDVSGLQPGRTYYYYFSALGKNSLIGRGKTCPAGPSSHLRFGVVSCANYEGGYFNAYGTLAQRNDIDAVLHLGDYIYEYAAGGYGLDLPDRLNNPLNELVSLSDYRTRYAQYRLDKNLIRLHQQHTMIAIWDDHESANDSYKDGAQNHQANEGSWETRKKTAKQAYFEWLPVRDNPEQSVYRKVAYGDLCDVFMLDTRLEGRDAPPPHFDTPDTPQRKMISDEQFKWFTDGLRQSKAHWKVVGNQVLFSSLNVGFAGGAFDGQPDFTNIDSIRQVEDLFIDNWESYPTQRDAIIDTLRNAGVQNTVILSGDSHESWAFDVSKKPVLYPVTTFFNLPQLNPYVPATREGYNKATGEGSWAVEFGGPSVSSPNFDEAVGADFTNQLEELVGKPIPPFSLDYNPHLKYVDLDRHGYFILDLKPDTAQANFYYVSSQLKDTLAENFGQGAYTLSGKNRVLLRGAASSNKSVQDQPTPLTPFGLVGAQEKPSALALFGISPNPAVDYAVAHFGLNQATHISIRIYDLQGRLITASPYAPYDKGLHRYLLPLQGLASGVYVVHLTSPQSILAVRRVQVR